jgi:pimeloyl-ACP methyl ester carboxylesterase
LGDIAGFGRPVLVLYGAQDTISPAADAVAMTEAARSGGSATTVVEIPDAVTHALLSWLATL